MGSNKKMIAINRLSAYLKNKLKKAEDSEDSEGVAFWMRKYLDLQKKLRNTPDFYKEIA